MSDIAPPRPNRCPLENAVGATYVGIYTWPKAIMDAATATSATTTSATASSLLSTPVRSSAVAATLSSAIINYH